MTIKKESGKEREFDTGAKRQRAEGKGTPVLFPGDAYLDVCKHFEDGAIHYGGRNWEKGLPLSTFIDSLERHTAQEKMGLTDESHDRAMAWNTICYLATKLRIKAGILPKELDDLEGAYGKQDAKKYNFKICKAYNDWFIVDEESDTYLWYDLELHKAACYHHPHNIDTEGYYSTKKAAEAVLQAYFSKRG